MQQDDSLVRGYCPHRQSAGILLLYAGCFYYFACCYLLPAVALLLLLTAAAGRRRRRRRCSPDSSFRTGKGVHAIGCNVGCKLIVPLAELAANGGHLSAGSLGQINALLPESIRVVDAHRVAKGYSAQKATEARRYAYVLPAAALRGASLAEFNAILREYEGVMRVHNFMGQKGSVPGEGGSGRGPPADATRDAEAIMSGAVAEVEGGGRHTAWPCFKDGQRKDSRCEPTLGDAACLSRHFE